MDTNVLEMTLVVVAYLFAVGYLGYRGYKGTRTTADYMLAGRRIHPFVMALSYGATFISTSAIVGFGGVAGLFGMGLLWLAFLNILVGIFIAFVFFGGRTRRMGHNLDAHTFPELLGRRYQSRFIQGFAGAVIFLFMPLYTAAVLIGAAKFIEQAFPISYEVALFFFATIVALYVILGGLKGVMYTDALQGSIMFAGMAVLLVYTYAQVGGVIEGHQALTDLASLVPPKLAAMGHQGWTAMPVGWSELWWILVSTIVLGVGIGVLAQPQLAVRFMTVRSKRELNRAVLVGGIFILFMVGVAFTVGALSNVLFYRETGQISVAAAGGDPEKIIPLYIDTFLPPWFMGLFMVTLLAAAMSTISSQFHAMGTAVGRDLCEMGICGREHKATVAITRLGIFIAFILSVLLAYFLPIKLEVGTAIIARATAIFFGLCASAFLPAYIGALYTRWVTRAGAMTGMLGGFIVTAFLFLFVHEKESAALMLCQRLTGKPSLLTGVTTGPFIWKVVDPLVVALPVSILLTVLVSLFTRRPGKEHLDRCFAGF